MCLAAKHRWQLERKLFSLFKESGELDFPNEDWVFEVIPELSSLETDTLDALLSQAAQHTKWVPSPRPPSSFVLPPMSLSTTAKPRDACARQVRARGA